MGLLIMTDDASSRKRIDHVQRSCVSVAALLIVVFGSVQSLWAQPVSENGHPDIQLFLDAGFQAPDRANEALGEIAAGWRDSYASLVWDLAWLSRPPSRGFQRFFTLVGFLGGQTGQGFGPDLGRWREWIWNQPYEPHPDYAYLKGQWYGQIDPRFRDFFPQGVTSRIRLDEIDWGGVAVNGIPPLYFPSIISAVEAEYLADDDIVFGIAIKSEARAYPKRILAWHEMAIDELGGTELTIVYCTLCGTVIPFESEIEGRHFTFGTSGLLYRSNKLMFDEETKNLWNTFEGAPVIGSLAETGLRLRSRAVVTTTWGEWRRAHRSTTVLSLDTGYSRDYSEGAAYRGYFGTDELMFEVNASDTRLANKEEVVTLRLRDTVQEDRWLAVAITARFLRDRPLYQQLISEYNLVVVTSEGGANRVFNAADTQFVRKAEGAALVDSEGRRWQMDEAALVLENDSAIQLPRVPAQRAFWFGWHAQFPDTVLID